MKTRHMISGFLLLAACGGATTGVGESAPPGGTGTGSGSGSGSGSGTGTGTGTGSSSSSSGGSSSGGSSSGGSSSGSTATCNPTNVAPTQTVTLRITNAGTSDRWIGTHGDFCDAIALSRGGKRLAQSLTFQCICECPNPGDTGRVSDYTKVAPGESVDVPWVAVEIDACTQSFDCKSEGWDTGIAQKWVSGSHPAAPGALHVELPVERDLPASCHSSGAQAWCDVGFGNGGGPTIPAGGLAQACTSTSTAAADFTLPASGDIVVPISVP